MRWRQPGSDGGCLDHQANATSIHQRRGAQRAGSAEVKPLTATGNSGRMEAFPFSSSSFNILNKSNPWALILQPTEPQPVCEEEAPRRACSGNPAPGCAHLLLLCFIYPETVNGADRSSEPSVPLLPGSSWALQWERLGFRRGRAEGRRLRPLRLSWDSAENTLARCDASASSVQSVPSLVHRNFSHVCIHFSQEYLFRWGYLFWHWKKVQSLLCTS